MVESKRCGLEGVVAEADVMVVVLDLVFLSVFAGFCVCFPLFLFFVLTRGPWASSSLPRPPSSKITKKIQNKNKNHDAELPQ